MCVIESCLSDESAGTSNIMEAVELAERELQQCFSPARIYSSRIPAGVVLWDP